MKILSFVWLVFFVRWASAAHPELLRLNTRPLQAESDLSALEPWETPISGFFIRNHHEVPIVDASKWILVIDGMVERPLKLTLKDLKKYSHRSLHAVLECAGNGRGLQTPKLAGIQWTKGAVGNAEWTGVRLSEILAKAKVKPGARFVTIEGADKPALPSVPAFIRSIPLSKALDESTLLAWAMNREPMPLLHGGPLRLVLPQWYGQNWIKWVRRITLTAEEDSGFYMKSGYRMPKTAVKPGEAWDSTTGTPVQEIRVQSLLVKPRPGAIVAAGNVEILGKAFSGSGTIAKVEISADEGKTWQLANLESPHPTGGWQEFRYSLLVADVGTHQVLSRATDSAGNTQPMEIEWNPSGYLRNNVDRVSFEVREPEKIQAKALLQDKCLSCHTIEIIQDQKLSSGGWEKVVKKMEKFGVSLTPDERTWLVDFLAKDLSLGEGPTRARVDFQEETKRFSVSPEKGAHLTKGKALYDAQCAACHGLEGGGKTAPRLVGRAIPEDVFRDAILEGRAGMPKFDLSKAEVVALRGYLQRAK